MPANSATAPLMVIKLRYSRQVHYQSINLENVLVKFVVLQYNVDWYRGFDEYHTSVFGNQPPQLCLDMTSQLKIFVEKPKNWAVVPTSVARGLVQNSDIRIVNAAFELPERTVYCLYSAEEEMDAHCRMFLQCLAEILKQKKEVTCLLDI